MTDAPQEEAAKPESNARPPQEMRLRPRRAPVMRLSRRVLVGLGVVAAAGISVALFFALQPQRRTTGPELYNTDNRTTPDGLASLPRNYGELPRSVPQLGPPLPGDLGRPILNAGRRRRRCRCRHPMQKNSGPPRNKRRRSQAISSRRPTSARTLARWPPRCQPLPRERHRPRHRRRRRDPVSQDHKLAFMNGNVDRRTTSPDRVQPAASPYVLQAGSVIPAALITGLRSDLPGEVTAQVTEDVYDTPTGKILLIPQGARLIGQYDAQVAFGQSRALLVWNRLIMPNGRSIVLERQPGTDPEGYAGLEDQVDNHWGMLFEAAILTTLLSIGSEAGANNNENALVQALRQGSSQGFSQVGEQVVGRSLNVQPTITIRPGFPVRVLVTHDLVLEPYPS